MYIVIGDKSCSVFRPVTMSILPPKINLDSPRYDQSTYWGRAKHFFLTTNPLNLLASPAQMEAAKKTVEKYKRDELTDISEDDLWAAKQLVDSAYHPETGEISSLSPWLCNWHCSPLSLVEGQPCFALIGRDGS